MNFGETAPSASNKNAWQGSSVFMSVKSRILHANSIAMEMTKKNCACQPRRENPKGAESEEHTMAQIIKTSSIPSSDWRTLLVWTRIHVIASAIAKKKVIAIKGSRAAETLRSYIVARRVVCRNGSGDRQERRTALCVGGNLLQKYAFQELLAPISAPIQA